MTHLAGSESGAAALGPTVLYLPKANRSDYFRRFLMHGKQQHGWRIVVPCQAAHRAGFVEIACGWRTMHRSAGFHPGTELGT